MIISKKWSWEIYFVFSAIELQEIVPYKFSIIVIIIIYH